MAVACLLGYEDTQFVGALIEQERQDLVRFVLAILHDVFHLNLNGFHAIEISLGHVHKRLPGRFGESLQPSREHNQSAGEHGDRRPQFVRKVVDRLVQQLRLSLRRKLFSAQRNQAF
jgi:hypothetical protein